MVLRMIDIELASKVSALLKDGDIIKIILDGVIHERKLIEHVGTYGLCVQGPTNKLTIPVEMTELYRKEADEMARATSIPGTPRGRPRGASGNQAPVEHPGASGTPPGGWLPPGSPLTAPPSTLAQDVASAEGTFNPPSTWQPPADPVTQGGTTINKIVELAQAKELPVQLAENDPDWIESAIDEMFDDMREKFGALINGINQNAETEIDKNRLAIVPTRSHTCFDCEHVDMDGTGSCGKFKCVPPMNVIVDPKTQCPDFVLSIPF